MSEALTLQSTGAGEADEVVVVFVHVFYPDVWDSIASRLADCMPEPFDLVITTSLEPSRLSRPATPLLRNVTILTAENRGRDMRPFLIAIRDVPTFSIALKLHTKRSEHRLDGTAWRDDLIQSLLPSKTGVGELLAGFRRDHRVGLVAPDAAILPLQPWILRNMGGLKRVAATCQLTFDASVIADAHFVAGSMFWFRREAILPLGAPDLLEMFEPEKGQVDGTAAHAVERLLAVGAEAKGFLLVPAGSIGDVHPATTFDVLQSRLRSKTRPSSRFLVAQPWILQMIDRYFPGAKVIYRRLPIPLRRLFRSIMASGWDKEG